MVHLVAPCFWHCHSRDLEQEIGCIIWHAKCCSITVLGYLLSWHILCALICCVPIMDCLGVQMCKGANLIHHSMHYSSNAEANLQCFTVSTIKVYPFMLMKCREQVDDGSTYQLYLLKDSKAIKLHCKLQICHLVM